MKEILKRISQDPGVIALEERTPGLSLTNENQEALIYASYFRKNPQDLLIVKPTAFSATNLYQQLLNYTEAYIFSGEESLQVDAIASSPEMQASRIETLIKIVSDQKPKIIVTNLAGIIRFLPKKEKFLNRLIRINKETIIKPKDLIDKLNKSGYQLVDRVDRPLTYSYRGEVIDIYSVQNNNPVRLEFFDDEIETIRTFDCTSQLTINNLEETEIYPASELIFEDEDKEIIKEAISKVEDLETKEHMEADFQSIEANYIEPYLYRYLTYLKDNASLIDYLDKPLVILSSKEEIDAHNRSILEENVAYLQDLASEKEFELRFGMFLDKNAVIRGKDVYALSQLADIDKPHSKIEVLHFPPLSLGSSLKELERESINKTVVITLGTAYIKRVIDELILSNIVYSIVEEVPIEHGLYLLSSELEQGFVYEDLEVVTARELFNIKVRTTRYSDKFRSAQVLNDYEDLAIGDYVVHNEYGIGKYLGIVTKEINGMHHDYLNIAYKGDSVLLVPLEQFRLVRKFIGAEGAKPRLNKLGSNEWKKTKEKVQEDVDQLAERLLQLYLNRENDIGFAFSPDGEYQKEFEDRFPHQLTKDQENAVTSIKQEMEQAKPMDCLLCGDVGFGKTEVAIRCAFKACFDHKQVALLCPTTILASQHFKTFTNRFEGYPVEIVLLSRFVPLEKQRENLLKIKEGKADIVIGTHRILSKDVQFKDLGLLIVDEEQRFGVESKEKIKELKNGVDVLSLSATPIPRTLQMSLIGIRTLAQLETPPENRYPVQTYLIEKNQRVIKEVIERELARDGQVFYLFNNVEFIYLEAAKIKNLVPAAKVAVVHGQMDREEIEDVMIKVQNNEYNVLVCTTIVENGIDIPNVNTILVDRADIFGLSQLYQIKGRVGRSNRLAYAYLMYNGKKQLSEIATKRLNAIKDFTQLGSGYKIAMRDLAIRGAGDLLGSQQAGFINTVGMDLYVSMLQEAIQKKKGIEVRQDSEIVPRSKIGVDGYIPVQYARKDYEKIQLYQRIDKATSESELKKLKDEVIDRYGHNPRSVELLFEKRRMEILANSDKVDEVRESKQQVEIYFNSEWSSKVDGVRFFEQVSKISLDIQMKYLKGKIIIVIPKNKNWLEMTNKILEAIKKL